MQFLKTYYLIIIILLFLRIQKFKYLQLFHLILQLKVELLILVKYLLLLLCFHYFKQVVKLLQL